MRAAPLFGLGEDRAQAVLGRVVEAIMHWPKLAKAVGMSATDMDVFAPAFAHPWLVAGKRGGRVRPT